MMSEKNKEYMEISTNGHYIIDGNGDPFFWIGDTAWSLFTRYSIEEVELYIDNRIKNGFTVIQCVLGWTGGIFDTSNPLKSYYGELASR